MTTASINKVSKRSIVIALTLFYWTVTIPWALSDSWIDPDDFLLTWLGIAMLLALPVT